MWRARRVLFCAALGLVLLMVPFSRVALGKTLSLTDLVVSSTSDGLTLYCKLESGLPEEVVESIESGIPVTFRYLAEVRRKRRFWPDETVSVAAIENAVKCDIIKKEYALVVDNSGHVSTRVTKEFAEIERWLTEVRGMLVANSTQLEEGERYYVRAKAEVESFHPPFPLRYLYSLLSLFRIRGDWAATSPFTVQK